MAGDGRSELLAACVLVKLGCPPPPPPPALREIRVVRPQALKTEAPLDSLFAQWRL